MKATGPIGAVILAAGASTRLGQPKQFLRHQNESLVRRTARAAVEAGCSPVVVVAGDRYPRIKGDLEGLRLAVCHHPGWAAGIGSSIRHGVDQALNLEPELDALVLMVCDQPFVTSSLIETLIVSRATGRKSVASTYAGTLGVPVLFDRAFFARLQNLRVDQGAKHLLGEFREDFGSVNFPDGAIDIDTPTDVQAHLTNQDHPQPANSGT